MKVFKAIGKGIMKVVKFAGVTIYCLIAIYTTLLTGCVGMMPTRKPPLTDALGFDVPNYKGFTTVGLNEAAYNWEAEKLNFWHTSMQAVNAPMIALHEQTVNWLNVGLSAGTFGGIPLAAAAALKKLPKGAVKEEDHLAAIDEALNTPVPTQK